MHLLDMESKCSLRLTETYRPAAAHRVALSGGETKDVLHPANRRLVGAAYIMSRRYTGHTRSDPLWKGRRLCGRTHHRFGSRHDLVTLGHAKGEGSGDLCLFYLG